VDDATREVVRVAGPVDDELLDAFYHELYLPAFRHQREPVEVWKERLADPAAPYGLCIAITGAHLRDPARRRLDGGVVCELYPVSGCGFITYLVVAPAARRTGLGRHLLGLARQALVAEATARGVELALVLAEVSDPARVAEAEAEVARQRLDRFQHWGARVLDVPYVQPDLAAGCGAMGHRTPSSGPRTQPRMSGRDRGLLLLALFDDVPPAEVDGARVAAFLRELYAVTEGSAEDDEVLNMLAMIDARVTVLRSAAAG